MGMLYQHNLMIISLPHILKISSGKVFVAHAHGIADLRACWIYHVDDPAEVLPDALLFNKEFARHR
jgi:hypothetical protein